MNVILITVGTRGDVLPFVALGKGLIKRGYQVTICTGESFRSLVEQYGLKFSPVRMDFLELAETNEGKQMMGRNPFHTWKLMKRAIFPMVERMLLDVWHAAQGADVMIYHPKVLGGYDIAEKRGIPAFLAHPTPVIVPTRLFANPALPLTFSSGFLNELTYSVNRLMVSSFLSIINKWRKETLTLDSKRTLMTNDRILNGQPVPVLYGCSPQVVPYDPAWKPYVCMSGFWFLEQESEWEPSPELRRFMKNGPPPIAVSFSSMPLDNPRRIWKMLEEALNISGQRGIILAGSSGMSEKHHSPHVFTVDSVPHDWLFPQTCGVIHHGGAGTTAAALKAGKPMIISPFTGDQPFWARRMKELGVATEPLTEKEMSVERLVHRIRELTGNPSLHHRADEMAAHLRDEKGVEATVDFIEEHLGSPE